jgi:hypothetical protein
VACCCERGNDTIFHNIRGISCLVDEVLASKKRALLSG